MKLVKEYLCDNKTPSDDEIETCIKLVNYENCIIKLKWFYPHNGWHERYIKKGMTFEEVKDSIPKRYVV